MMSGCSILQYVQNTGVTWASYIVSDRKQPDCLFNTLFIITTENLTVRSVGRPWKKSVYCTYLNIYFVDLNNVMLFINQ